MFADHERVPLWRRRLPRHFQQILPVPSWRNIEFTAFTLHDGDALLPYSSGRTATSGLGRARTSSARTRHRLGSPGVSGSGAHCLGAHLARHGGRAVAGARRKGPRFSEVDEANAVRVHSSSVRGFANLPITVKKA